jgi:hypothetical protein
MATNRWYSIEWEARRFSSSGINTPARECYNGATDFSLFHVTSIRGGVAVSIALNIASCIYGKNCWQ